MTAVTAEQQGRTIVAEGGALVAADEGPVAFYSKGTHLRLVRQHGMVKMNPLNNSFFDDPDHPSIVVEFAPKGRVEVSAGEGFHVDGRGWLADREELERRGMPTDQNVPRDLVTALRSHKGYNVDFFEEGAEPGRPQPSPEKFAEMVTDYTIAFDTENLKGLLEAEKGSHNRPQQVQLAEQALRKVEAAWADAQEQQAEAEKGGGKK
jgi:hypothetical protein